MTLITFSDSIIIKSDRQASPFAFEDQVLEHLFSSRVRVQLLTLFLLNPDSSFHAQALAKRIDAHYSAVWKELVNLEKAGVLLSESSPNIKAYRLNPRLPILPELRAMVLKTFGAGDRLRQALTGLGAIQAGFIYGSVADGKLDSHSDIDLMLIGNINLNRLAPVIATLERELNKSVNYLAYSPAEWQEKRQAHEPFIENVLKAKKIMLIGDEDALRPTRKPIAHQSISSQARRSKKTLARRRARSRNRRTKPAR